MNTIVTQVLGWIYFKVYLKFIYYLHISYLILYRFFQNKEYIIIEIQNEDTKEKYDIKRYMGKSWLSLKNITETEKIKTPLLRVSICEKDRYGNTNVYRNIFIDDNHEHIYLKNNVLKSEGYKYLETLIKNKVSKDAIDKIMGLSSSDSEEE